MSADARNLVESILSKGDHLEPMLTAHLHGLVMDTPEDNELLGRIQYWYDQWAEDVRALRALSNEPEPTPTVNVRPPDPDLGIDHWTVVGDLRRDDDDNANYECRDVLIEQGFYPSLFDPEHSCFFAYVPTEGEARIVAAAIDKWVGER